MKKVLAIIGAALLFAAVAGGTMFGISKLANRNKAQGTEAASAEAQAGTTAEQKETKLEKTSQEGTKALPQQNSVMMLDASEIVEEAMPQVVAITNTMVVKQQGYGSIFDYIYGGNGGYTQEYEVPASGSGVIIQKNADELLIVTNNHVVQDSKELMVTFIDGETVPASLKGTDSTIDIAVISVSMDDLKKETLDAIKVATLHDTEDLKVGQGVVAIGNALGFGQSVTVGVISALDREIQSEEGVYSNLIQVDAAINPGNSGGALLNIFGELIGINVAKYAETSVEGVGYAIPIYKAVSVIENLANAKTKIAIDEDKQGRLGVYINTVSQEQANALSIPSGVMVIGFCDEEMEGYEKSKSAAHDAGMLKNDIITKFDGQGVKTAEELMGLVKYYEAGSKVDVTVQRLENGEYQEKVITVTLTKASDAASKKDKESGEDGEAAEEDGKLNGKKPGRKEKPSWDGKQKDQQENPREDQQNGQSGQDSGDDSWSYDSELYDLFKEFMNQYQ